MSFDVVISSYDPADPTISYPAQFWQTMTLTDGILDLGNFDVIPAPQFKFELTLLNSDTYTIFANQNFP